MRRVGLAMLLAACGPDTQSDSRGPCTHEFLDSQGRVYPNEEEYGCFPGVRHDSLEELCEAFRDNLDPRTANLWGRIFAPCQVCDNAIYLATCRPLVCARDEECPQFELQWPNGVVTTGTYECRNGVCQNADLEKYPEDVIDEFEAKILCQADLERDGSLYDGEPYCPDAVPGETSYCPLPLPAECMQP